MLEFHFATTVALFVPMRLRRTVMFRGFTDQLN
jgi:hypothetical protein